MAVYPSTHFRHTSHYACAMHVASPALQCARRVRAQGALRHHVPTLTHARLCHALRQGCWREQHDYNKQQPAHMLAFSTEFRRGKRCFLLPLGSLHNRLNAPGRLYWHIAEYIGIVTSCKICWLWDLLSNMVSHLVCTHSVVANFAQWLLYCPADK